MVQLSRNGRRYKVKVKTTRSEVKIPYSIGCSARKKHDFDLKRRRLAEIDAVAAAADRLVEELKQELVDFAARWREQESTDK